MEKDLTTLLAERDVLKHKAELEQLREENRRLLQQVQDKIDNAQLEITDKAISRSMEVLEKTRLWLQWGVAAFAVLVTVAGLIGYNGLDKRLTAYYTDTVHNWLRFDDDNSGGRKALEDLRTSALLDSLTLRYARERSNSGYARVTLNAAEEQRLMALIVNPTTDESQYRDALNLIIKSRGMFGRVYDDDTGKQLAAIARDEKYSNAKRAAIFANMQHERALLPLSRGLLNDTSGRNDEGILMYAFDNVRKFDDHQAQAFARQHLESFKNDSYRIRLAKYLIDSGADGENINRLLDQLKHEKQEMWMSGYQEIVFARIMHALSAIPVDVPTAAQLLSQQIDAGLQLKLDDFATQRPYIQLSLDRYSQSLEQPQQVVGNPALVDAVVKSQPLTLAQLARMSEFFQLSDRNFWLTTLMMQPGAETRLQLADERQVVGSEVLAAIWLRVEPHAGQPALIASWRDKSGVAQEGIVSDIAGGESAHFHVDYNQAQLTSYTWHRDYSDPDLL